MDLAEKIARVSQGLRGAWAGYPVFQENRIRSVDLGLSGPAETHDAIR